MDDAAVTKQARQLIETLGDKAGRKAAYNELEAEENGDDAGARDWHWICLAIKEIQG